jgi:hypothetical protein
LRYFAERQLSEPVFRHPLERRADVISVNPLRVTSSPQQTAHDKLRQADAGSSRLLLPPGVVQSCRELGVRRTEDRTG